MAIEDAAMRLGPYGANSPFLEAGAAVQSGIFIRIGDAEKEHQAYVLADQRLDAVDERQAAKASMVASCRKKKISSMAKCHEDQRWNDPFLG